MATEAIIRKKAVKILEDEGYIVWCPAKVKYKQNDIFGIFDSVSVKDSDVRYIQWTSSMTTMFSSPVNCEGGMTRRKSLK